eukprot:CAMPEP_0179447688 /NCGR_PEP_ID=MMETSP0799-20121207/31480_1 /TAXON_ID=46947 /ORGANISM="Geminigera cryophila, Strain CCMP2564" /LENGTH=47 /DNA_ID= /DNA_START= /DNA_END= /DNA_ORIENTATION=
MTLAIQKMHERPMEQRRERQQEVEEGGLGRGGREGGNGVRQQSQMAW